jgi:cysteine desulfurase / selenocysteine lyase
MIDLERARLETPGCKHVLHFNNAGAALTPTPVIDAVQAHLDLESRIGGYEAADAAARQLEETYEAIAELLGSEVEQLALFESATTAWQIAFHSLQLGPGDRILTAVSEYASNYISMLQMANRRGVIIQVVPNDDEGQIDVASLDAAIDSRVKLIALTHVPSSSGLVNPAEAVGAVARRAGITYLLDASQSAGQVPLDVKRLGCDFLVATGRKYLRGPRGTAFLCVARERIAASEPDMLDLHGAEWVALERYELRGGAARFETFEFNVAARIGLGAAVGYALGWGIGAIETSVGALAASLRKQLADVPGVTVRDRGRRLCGIVTFTIAGVSAADARARLHDQGINVWVSTVGTARLDLETRGIDELVRASVHYYNSAAEVERFVAAVRALNSKGAPPVGADR